jgi:hypothetical protein
VLGVAAVATLGNIEAQALEPLDSISATGVVGTLRLKTTAGLSGIEGTLALGTLTTTAVVFDFNAVRELYDRRRTINIDRAA